MPKLKCLLVLSIPKETLINEFRWRYHRWGEDAVKTYLVKNSHLIDKDLTLLGIGELPHYRPPKPETSYNADMIFRKNDIYYVVEVKDSRDYAFKQLIEEVASFEYDTMQHNEPCEEIIPVLAMVDDSIKEVKPDWREMEDWMKSYINELLKGK